jgi:hypothetical protein
MEPPESIEKSKLLLAEGADAANFFHYACRAFGVNDIKVLDFGGVSDLTAYLKMLQLLPGYEQVTTIAIVRDAEKDPLSAVRNIKQSLAQASLPVPNEPYEFISGYRRVAFMILPGFEQFQDVYQTLLPGTLEDLLLNIAQDKSTFGCVDAYIECLRSKRMKITKLHKIKLHTYLSGMENYCGLKIGEASKVGAWDWNHINLEKIKAIITTM